MPTVQAPLYLGQIASGDTVEIPAYLRINGQPVTQDQIASVVYSIQRPDETVNVDNGTIQDDGSGFYRWPDTSQLGDYLVQAQFVLLSGEVRSVMMRFSIFDPFNPPVPSETDLLVDQVRMRLEDCFDSMDGGPWLKDKSPDFDNDKIAAFIPEALLDINVQMPPTNFTIDNFTMPIVVPGQASDLNPNLPLLVKGVLVLTIRHLMRSYTEQPMPQNNQTVWNDRTRYQQLWSEIYQVEYADYIEKVRLWKRTTLQLGHSGLLTFSKAGRLYPYGSQRSRGVYRGYN